MHHGLWMVIFGFLSRKVLDAVWNYGKQLVEAVAFYILVVRFVAFFLASYVSQSRPVISGRA
jgi:hypothetical protein